MITLKKGSKGFKVKQLQKLLRMHVDGIFGQKTENMVVTYQRKYGLVVDGIVGFSTWNSLLQKRASDKFRDEFRTIPTSDNYWHVDPLLGTLFKDTARNRKMLIDGFKALSPFAAQFKLNTPHRFMHFVSQMREEVGSNITVEENLNYSCKALQNIFSVYERSPKLARQDGRCDGHIARKYNIARRAYGGRMGNKPFPDHEGYLYRGRGSHMTTGKNNYTELDNYVRLSMPELYKFFKPLRTPDILASEENWLISGAVYWLTNRLYENADYGLSMTASNLITDKINRYTDSHDSRYRHLKLLQRVYT